jgi:hypothetical protein
VSRVTRREEERQGDRRIVREYDDEGHLARIRIEPLPPRAFQIVAIEPVKEAPPPPPPPSVEAIEAPPPAPPVRYDVPDLDAKVDALLARRDRPVRARKRAPIPIPQFEPLRREPWEDRLDKALGRT